MSINSIHHINGAVEYAREFANRLGNPVSFVFNEFTVTVKPGDSQKQGLLNYYSQFNNKNPEYHTRRCLENYVEAIAGRTK